MNEKSKKEEIRNSIYYKRMTFNLLRSIKKENPGPYDYNYLCEQFDSIKREFNIQEEAPYDILDYCEAVISSLVENGIFERIQDTGEEQFRRIVFFDSQEEIKRFEELRRGTTKKQEETTKGMPIEEFEH